MTPRMADEIATFQFGVTQEVITLLSLFHLTGIFWTGLWWCSGHLMNPKINQSVPSAVSVMVEAEEASRTENVAFTQLCLTSLLGLQIVLHF